MILAPGLRMILAPGLRMILAPRDQDDFGTPALAEVMFFCWGRRGFLGDQAVVGAGGYLPVVVGLVVAGVYEYAPVGVV